MVTNPQIDPHLLRGKNVWEGRNPVPFHFAIEEGVKRIPLGWRDRLATFRGSRAVSAPVDVYGNAVRYLGFAVSPHRQCLALGRRSESGVRVASGDAVHPAPVAMDSLNEGCNAWSKPARIGVAIECRTHRRLRPNKNSIVVNPSVVFFGVSHALPVIPANADNHHRIDDLVAADDFFYLG